MKFTVYFTILLAILTYASAEGGGMASGGGKSIVCFDSKESASIVRESRGVIFDELIDGIISIDALDLKYSQLPSGFDREKPSIVPLLENENFKEYLSRVNIRIKKMLPNLYFHIQSAKRALSKNIMLREASLKLLNDENDSAVYESATCTTVTMATQYFESGEFFLDIDNRLFNHSSHSEVSKATLLLHEYLYFIARKNGVKDSRSTRKAVKILLNNNERLLHEVTHDIFKLGFFSSRPEFISNGYHSSVDFNLYAGPLHSIYSMSASTLGHLGRLIQNFKKEESIELKYRVQAILERVGLDISPIRHFSMAKKEFEASESLLMSLFPDDAILLKKKLDKFSSDRFEMIRLEREHYLEKLFDIFYSDLNYLSNAELSALKEIVYNVTRVYENIIKGKKLQNSYVNDISRSGFLKPISRGENYAEFYPEEFSRLKFFLLEFHPDGISLNTGLLGSMIAKACHEVNIISYEKLRFIKI